MIYNKYSKRLFAYAITLVKLENLAEDVVQDVFIRLWDARMRINIDKSFQSYLYRVCHNRVCDINKEVAKTKDLLKELIYYNNPVNEPEQTLSEEAKDYIPVLKNALDQLTPQRRRIFEMCKGEKKTYVEVAKELGISPNTVKNHMMQIFNILRAYLRRQEGIILFVIIFFENCFENLFKI